MSYICPACGFDELTDPPYDGLEPSYDICPCCDYQFGRTDRDEEITFEEWRKKWINEGMNFRFEAEKPEGWYPKKQLLNIGVKI
jgi:hypothetical protein